MTKKHITSNGDTVDYIIWKAYGTQKGRILEQVLDANPGLADIGPVLPAGVTVVLPEITLETDAQGVRLWT